MIIFMFSLPTILPTVYAGNKRTTTPTIFLLVLNLCI